MQTISAESLFATQLTLGETPLWHPSEHRLYWVDIDAGHLYRSNPDMAGYERYPFKTSLGAYCFRAEGGFILASGEGFLVWDLDQETPAPLWNPLPADRPEVRLNDGKVDPAGRFYAGSMDVDQVKAELYRIDPDGSQHTVLQNVGISNGLGWSPDRKKMYYIDSLRATVYKLDYDLATGELTNQQPLIIFVEDSEGFQADSVLPDGLCVDAEGCIWVAHWNGWEVRRYDPTGKPLLSVQVPAQRVTACAFGGDQLDQLYITTARSDLSAAALVKQPLAGNIFVVQTKTQGQPVNFYGQSAR